MQTKSVGKTTRNLLKGAAVASTLAMGLIGSHASAETFILASASMNTSYIADIGSERAFSNGVTFQVTGYNVPPTDSLYGFCFDIYHNMYLGPLDYLYNSNQDTGGGLVPNSPQTLDATQISAITNLVDTGWLLHQQDADGNALKTAAIQAAIWEIEAPGTVSVENGGATLGLDTKTFQEYFTDYSTGNYKSLADGNDKVFTISDGAHQSFAVGWPLDAVPEPTVWAMLLSGFFGIGAALRRRKASGAALA